DQDEDQPVTPADAAMPPTSTPDAPSNSLCELGCTNGTCVAGVCVIDCAPLNACPNDVMCPPNLPCRVICGEQACKKKVNCTMATSCEVQCGGTNACADDIQCPAGDRCT